MRIENHPIINFQRRGKITFFYNGSLIEAYEGETIMAALHAAGVKALNKSKKHNRFRGLFCAIGKCSSCLMTVNGIENVPICVTKAEQDMVVESTLGSEFK
ncbi:(2Fe-2S)-binding protein [Anaerobranca gottschalkii]|uniref:2Fe-2S iron-sulfur cluster binding domain-containing protein n=1 Tax=Anaerobranca gottschalkii DSM 13577 TaxID=1120990 RepID=A0A1H9Y9P3_9FIRM|nr:(2Fe-2S)-binding protein [Anaerobranca gottschalkii]SES65111.1 2Fe-2S iron-sulfur cluster binding domain-containing protein [Anaerobranca gottschalkii DSM 13577]